MTLSARDIANRQQRIASDPGVSAFVSASAGSGKTKLLTDRLLRLMLGMSPHTLPAVILALVEHVPQHLNPAGERLLVQRGLALAKRMRQLLGDDGILLFPPHPTTAPLVTRAQPIRDPHRGSRLLEGWPAWLQHMAPLFTPFNFCFTAIINILELPATAVRRGRRGDGGGRKR